SVVRTQFDTIAELRRRKVQVLEATIPEVGLTLGFEIARTYRLIQPSPGSAPGGVLTEPRLLLAWPSQLGTQYQLEVSDDLQSWRPLGINAIIGTSHLLKMEQPIAGGSRFYRLLSNR